MLSGERGVAATVNDRVVGEGEGREGEVQAQEREKWVGGPNRNNTDR